MLNRRPRGLLAAAALVLTLLCAAPPALAAVTVQLRIEGSNTTLFEGPVNTDAKTITKDASGPHKCDGTNGGANPTPGPTMTTALDDGSIAGGFTWDGTWYSGFEDFGIDRIGPDANSSTQFWGYALNYQPSSVGGCQQKVQAGDEILFAYDFFSKTHLLKLSGPSSANTGEPVTLTVVDGQNGSPVAGAQVAGRLTGPDGKATVTFDTPGERRLKADRADSVRSNAIVVCVHQGNDGTCGTTRPDTGSPPPPDPDGGQAATQAPAQVKPPYRDPAPFITFPRRRQRFEARRGPRELRGIVDIGTAGLQQVKLRLTRKRGSRCEYYSGRVEDFRRTTKCGTGYWFKIGDRAKWSYLLPERLGPGRYLLEVAASDRNHQRDVYSLVFIVERDRR